MSVIGNIAGSLLHAVLPVNLFPNNSATANAPVSGSPAPGSDSGRLSSFARLITTLQQLQQSSPGRFQEVTRQIAADLKTAAQSAQTAGNTPAAYRLSQLAADFGSASASGQFPNLENLAQPADSAVNGAAQTFTQFLAAAQSGGPGNSSLNAATIIQNALTNAGIGIVSA
jgi:hypothetical protein